MMAAMVEHDGSLTYPLLDAQSGVLLACEAHPLSTAWNLPSVIFFDKTISVPRLVESLRLIISTRTSLHIQFLKTDDGEIRQYVVPEMKIPVVMRLMDDEEAEQYMKETFIRPFELFTTHPLCRFEVVETDRRVLLLTDFHHSIADGFTIAHSLMAEDLPAAFSRLPLAEPRLTILQWTHRERDQLSSPAYDLARSYYQRLFSDCEATSLSRGSTLTDSWGRRLTDGFQVSSEWLEKWCSEHATVPFHLLMAAFSLTLSKLSHQSKVTFCTLNHGRYDKRLRGAYGMFVCTVPFLVDIGQDMTVADLITQIRHRLMDSLRHRAYPFTHFCREVGMIPKITFGYQSSGILEQTIIDGRRFKGIQLQQPFSQSDLSVMVYMDDESFEIRIDASDTLYDEADLRRFATAMQHCLDEMMHHEDALVAKIQLTDSAERQRLLQLSAGRSTGYDPQQTVVSLFLKQAAATPDALAVSDGQFSLTYSELERRSRVLAYLLMSRGVEERTFVGVDTTPCCEFLVAVLAIMRLGAAYVPIDPHLPTHRREQIIKDAGIHYVINAQIARQAPSSSHTHLPLDRSSAQLPAYMIYTSGTTGAPKGVAVRHRALVNLIHFCVRRWPLRSDSRIACHSTMAFDASVEDLFPVLTVGGSVWIVPDPVRTDLGATAQFISQHRLTGGCYTTRLGVALAQTMPLDVDYLCLGGERLLAVPNVRGRVYNTYGPTEFTVDATYYELEKGKTYSTIPIGRPVDNCHAFVVDQYGCLLPQGATGELWLGGEQIADGYWNDAALTKEKFTACDFYNGTVYHTGDLARWNSEGLLEFMGRIDHEVKIDGVRVSLSEIEQQMLALPEVTQTVALSHDVNGKPFVEAFFVATQEMNVHAMADFLRQRLPSQMIPKRMCQLKELPLTLSGKIDRRMLLSTHLNHLVGEQMQPADDLEKKLCLLMGKILGFDMVGATDDFFMLGGTSLSAMQVVADARKEGLGIAFGDVFAYPTPRLLANMLRHHDEEWDGEVSRYDYRSINHLLSLTSDGVCRQQLAGGTLALTGSTGFLGIHILHRFLETPSWQVVCLLRGRDEKAACDRLRDRWNYYFGDLPMDAKRVRVVCCDLTQGQSLLPLYDMPFDLLVNCAAETRYFAPDQHIIQVNAEGVGQLADICQHHGARMIQISTKSVAGTDVAGRMQTITPQILYQGQRFIDQYSHSKFMAERTVLERIAKGQLKGAVIRMGHLAPRTTDGKASVNMGENMLASVLKMMVELGVCPAFSEQLMVEQAPVDQVARQVTVLSVSPVTYPVIHIDGRQCSLKSLADQAATATLRLCSNEEFCRRLQGYADETPVKWLLDQSILIG